MVHPFESPPRRRVSRPGPAKSNARVAADRHDFVAAAFRIRVPFRDVRLRAWLIAARSCSRGAGRASIAPRLGGNEPSLASPRGWSAERRSCSQSTPSGAGARNRRARAARRSIAAVSRPGTVTSGDGREPFGRPDPGRFPHRSSVPVQPTEGRLLVVGADGDPRRPGPMRAKHRCRRRTRSAIKTPRDDALG